MSTPAPGNPPDRQLLGYPDPGGRLSTSGRPATPHTGDVAAAAATPAADSATDQCSGTDHDLVPTTTADEIAALVLAVPDVVSLHTGRFGEVATYLPGRRVTGVRVNDDGVEIHVVVAAATPIRQTARLIHTAVEALVAMPVHVYIEDLAVA